MAKDLTKQPIEHRGFKGLRNTVPEDELEIDKFGLTDLLTAQNVDIDDEARIKRRTGHGAAVVAGSCRSLWSDGNVCFVLQNDTSLVEIHPNYSVTTHRTGLAPGLHMAFTSLAGRTYYANGVNSGVVEPAGARSWGLAIPALPGPASLVGGSLPLGRYQVVVTYVRSDGQESGASKALVIDVDSTGGFQLTGLPVSLDPDVTSKHIYVSRGDGEAMYRAGTVGNGVFGFTYNAVLQGLIPLRTQHLGPPPAGTILDTFNGRILVASGPTLYYSEPWSPELFDLRKNFRFNSPITFMVALKSGVYVGTQTAIAWLEGATPEGWQYVPKASYGGIEGASTRCNRDEVLDGKGDGQVAIFGTKQGICLGQEGGSMANLTFDRYRYPVQDRGAVVLRQHREVVQFILATQGT